MIRSVLTQPLDDDLLGFTLESPDLGDLKCGIDSRTIDPRRRDVDLDRQGQDWDSRRRSWIAASWQRSLRAIFSGWK